MVCHSCGKEIEGTAKFCKFCGTPVEKNEEQFPQVDASPSTTYTDVGHTSDESDVSTKAGTTLENSTNKNRNVRNFAIGTIGVIAILCVIITYIGSINRLKDSTTGGQRYATDIINRNNESVADPSMYSNLTAARKDIFIPQESMKKANASYIINGELPIPEYGYDGIPTIGFDDIDNDNIQVTNDFASSFYAAYALQYFRITNVLVSDVYVDGDLLVVFSGEFEFQFNKPSVDESIFPIDESKRYIIEGQVGASADQAAGINSKIVMFSCSIYEDTGEEWWMQEDYENDYEDYSGYDDGYGINPNSMTDYEYYHQFTGVWLPAVAKNSVRFRSTIPDGTAVVTYGEIWSIHDDYATIWCFSDDGNGAAECHWANADWSGITSFNVGDDVYIYGVYCADEFTFGDAIYLDDCEFFSEMQAEACDIYD